MSYPQTMKAAQWTKLGSDIDNITIVDVPVKAPGPTQIVVKNKYAALNPVDLMVQAGVLKPAGWSCDPPFTPGYDFAGSVVAVGSEVQKFKAGDEIYGVNWGKGSHNSEPQAAGTLAEYVTVEQYVALPLPDGLPADKACGSALIATTGYEGVYDHLKVEKGQKIMILGGATGVGRLAIPLCKRLGCWVATTCSPRNMDLVKSLGPDFIVDYTKEKNWSDYDELQGIDGVFAIPATETLETARKALKADGKFVSISSHDAGFDPTAHPPLTYAGFFCFSNNTKYLEEFNQSVLAGEEDMLIESTNPFTNEGVRAAFKKQAGGKSLGKNVIKF